MILTILPLFILFQTCFSANLEGDLIFSHVIFRHGDRTPVEPYPTDPWKDRKFWPTDFGQLTNKGKMQHYNLGKWLRNRYQNLISKEYKKDEVYIQSTDVDRTLMSALSNLAGLYEPKNDDVWNNDIKWQPIPVHTSPEKDDYILAAKKPCLAYYNAYEKMKSSAKFRKLDKKYAYLFDYLTKYTGKVINAIEGIERIYNTFYIEELYNLTLPTWTKKVYPGGDMKEIADFSFSLPTYNKLLARLKVGPLIKQILERFKTKITKANKIKQSLWIYSAHDTTIANVLNALGLFEPHSPPYTATIMFELRVNNGKQLLSIFYKNTTETPEPLVIPNCGVQCPLDSMFKLYNDILPVKWEDECNASTFSWMSNYISNIPGSDQSSYVLLFLGFLAFICLVFTSIYFILMFYRRRQYVNYRCYVQ